jgi:hypothetical protein
MSKSEESALKYKKYNTNLACLIDVENICILMEYINS